jgi:YD repeat-containing protein
MKTSVAVMLVLALLLCLFVETAAAQSQSPCDTGTAFGVVGFFLQLIGVNCEPWGLGVGVEICSGKNTSCSPPGSASEGGGGCPNCSKPVSLLTGNTYIEQTDLQIPGLGNGLTLTRRWNSQWPPTQMASQVGLFGPNWRSTYEERIFLGNDGYLRYARADGTFWSFGLGGPGWSVVAPKNAGATVVQGTSYWTLTLRDGEQRRFDINSGSLIAIIDRNGNTTQVAYDGINRLTTVTDPVSRHLYFYYPNNTSFLVSSVSSDVGLSLTYGYDTQNRLSQVIMPDQSTLNFQYDGNSMITFVLDSNMKVLESHTYDNNHRALTSSQANGVQAVTISYP